MTKFNPEGSGYDYESAKKHGIKPETIKGKKKWQSWVPETGLILKGRKHKTWWMTEQGEKKQGNRIIKKGDRYYSVKTILSSPKHYGGKVTHPQPRKPIYKD